MRPIQKVSSVISKGATDSAVWFRNVCVGVTLPKCVVIEIFGLHVWVTYWLNTGFAPSFRIWLLMTQTRNLSPVSAQREFILSSSYNISLTGNTESCCRDTLVQNHCNQCWLGRLTELIQWKQKAKCFNQDFFIIPGGATS